MNDDHSRARRGMLLQAVLIGGTGGMLLVKVLTGALPLYVHARYTPMIASTALVLIGLALARMGAVLRPTPSDEEHDHSPSTFTWRSPAVLALLVPIALGLLIPSRALTGAAIDTRGFGNSAGGMRNVQGGAETSGSFDTGQWTLLDWVNALIYHPDNPRLQGQPIEVIGFVWRDEGLTADQFYVARFVVSCCTADSLAIYLPVQWSATVPPEGDLWVRVQGTVGLSEKDGKPVAIIQATELLPIPQPAEPYLSP